MQCPIQPRYSHSTHVLRDRLLFLIGGITFPTHGDLISSPHSTFDNIAVLDLSTLSWFTVNFPASFEKWPICVHGHTSILEETKDGGVKLTIIGGGSNCFSFGTALTKTPIRFSLENFRAFEAQNVTEG